MQESTAEKTPKKPGNQGSDPGLLALENRPGIVGRYVMACPPPTPAEEPLYDFEDKNGKVHPLTETQLRSIILWDCFINLLVDNAPDPAPLKVWPRTVDALRKLREIEAEQQRERETAFPIPRLKGIALRSDGSAVIV